MCVCACVRSASALRARSRTTRLETAAQVQAYRLLSGDKGGEQGWGADRAARVFDVYRHSEVWHRRLATPGHGDVVLGEKKHLRSSSFSSLIASNETYSTSASVTNFGPNASSAHASSMLCERAPRSRFVYRRPPNAPSGKMCGANRSRQLRGSGRRLARRRA